MKEKIFAILSVAAVLASCTADIDDCPAVPEQPIATKNCLAVVSFTVPQTGTESDAPSARGARTPYKATAENADKDSLNLSFPAENKLDGVVLYLYNAQSGNFADSVHVSHLKSEGVQYGNTMRFSSDSIRLDAGEYRVYAVANTTIAAKDISTERALLGTVLSGRSIVSVVPDGGIVMTNRGNSAVTVDVTPNSVSLIDISLERAVAKVEVGKRHDSYVLRDKAGNAYARITPGSFYFVNLSRDFYLFRHVGKFDKNVTPTAEAYAWSMDNFGAIPDADGYLVDPHFFDKRWDKSNSFDGASVFDNALTDIARTGNQYSSTLFPATDSYTKSYILENANFWTAQREGYTTGMVIRSVLTPEKSRCFDESGNNVDPQAVSGLYYFNYAFYTSLDAVKAIGGGNIPTGSVTTDELYSKYSIKYFPIDDKSLYPCYYKHWIKHFDNGDNRKVGVMEYGVVRNNWYRITIADVAGLGYGTVHVEPTRPVEEDNVLLVDYKVTPWEYRPDDAVLTKSRSRR